MLELRNKDGEHYWSNTEYETAGNALNSLHNQCPGGWTSEYTGWLMSEYPGDKGCTMFVCVDKDAQALPGLGADNSVALMYHASVWCNNGIPCPPYLNVKDLACVVCTK